MPRAFAGKAYNLRQIQRIISNCVEDQILQPIYNAEEFISQRGHGGWMLADGRGDVL
jgi:hypothetical protein